MSYLRRLKHFMQTHMIMCGVGVSVLVAVLLTSISMWAYNSSDVARLDVSRPGYETIRDEVKNTEETKKFGATGELNEQAFEDFQLLYDERLHNLGDLGRFDGAVLNDDQLKLAEPTPPVE